MDRQICVNFQSKIQNLSGIGYNYFYVTSRCSRACAQCLAAAPLCNNDPEPFAKLDNIARACDWAKKMNRGMDLHKLDISGGDPMLHPELIKMLELFKEKFPTSPIKVRCNGMGLENMTDEKWEAFKRLEIRIDVRSYNMKNLVLWKEAGRDHGVLCDAYEFGNEFPINFNSIQYVPEPKVDGFTRYLWCSEPHRCVGIDCCLDRPRYYRCSLPMSYRHIERNWPETKADSHLVKWDPEDPDAPCDYFEIDDNPPLEQVTRIYTFPNCHHCCRGESPLRFTADTVSKKIKMEYVLKQDVPMGAGFPAFVFNDPEWLQAPFSCSDHAHQQGYSCSEECKNKCGNFKKEPFTDIKKEEPETEKDVIEEIAKLQKKLIEMKSPTLDKIKEMGIIKGETRNERRRKKGQRTDSQIRPDYKGTGDDVTTERSRDIRSEDSDTVPRE